MHDKSVLSFLHIFGNTLYKFCMKFSQYKNCKKLLPLHKWLHYRNQKWFTRNKPTRYSMCHNFYQFNYNFLTLVHKTYFLTNYYTPNGKLTHPNSSDCYCENYIPVQICNSGGAGGGGVQRCIQVGVEVGWGGRW